MNSPKRILLATVLAYADTRITTSYVWSHPFASFSDGQNQQVLNAILVLVPAALVVGLVSGALDVQRLVQRGHFLRRCRFGRIDPPCEEREFLRIGMDMGVAVAGAGWHVEIHRCRRLGGFGKNVSIGHCESGRDGRKQHSASREHGSTLPVCGECVSSQRILMLRSMPRLCR